jgi:hypothetical protein
MVALSLLEHIYLSHFFTSPFAIAALDHDAEAPKSNDIGADISLDRFLLAPSVSDPAALPLLHADELHDLVQSPEELAKSLSTALSYREDRLRSRARAFEVFTVLQRTWTQNRMARADELRGAIEGSLGQEVRRLCGQLRCAVVISARGCL